VVKPIHSVCSVYRYLRNISIPAAFITRTDGDALKVWHAAILRNCSFLVSALSMAQSTAQRAALSTSRVSSHYQCSGQRCRRQEAPGSPVAAVTAAGITKKFPANSL
jgi:hypothetical protein